MVLDYLQDDSEGERLSRYDAFPGHLLRCVPGYLHSRLRRFLHGQAESKEVLKSAINKQEVLLLVWACAPAPLKMTKGESCFCGYECLL
jgi:hypothetical protein